MPVFYKAYQSTLKDKNQRKLFYPRAISTGRVETNQIAKEIAAYSSLSPGDVKNTIDNLVIVMTRHLQDSKTVSLDGLGSFRIVIRSAGKGVEHKEAVSAKQATLHVVFVPASTRNPDMTIATRSLLDGAKCAPYTAPVPLPDQEEDEEEDDDDLDPMG